jgi:hypothetical protein
MSDTPTWSEAERKGKERELFDTANRVQYRQYLEANALDPVVALQPAERVKEVYFREAEKDWPEFQRVAASRPESEVRYALGQFQAQEAALGPEKPITLMDALQAHGIFPLLTAHQDSVPHASAGVATPGGSIRDTTRGLINAVCLDCWPSLASIADFGLDSQTHYEALYYPLRNGEISPEALDAALGHGEKLTALARNAPSNPHKGVSFYTSWDVMFGRKAPDAPESGRTRTGSSPPEPEPRHTRGTRRR